jgi:uncharacterized protein (TIGR02996 family)
MVTVTMNDAFLQSICENPEDDVVRLIYADWLEDNGDPRGEFIRAQVELAQLTTDSPRRRELAFRAHQLLGLHGEEWSTPLRSFVEEWQFSRGFINKVTISANSLVSHAEDLFRLAPLQRIRLIGADGDIGFLSALPGWAPITSLDLIANNLSADLLTAMIDAPALRQLKRLVLCGNPIGEAGAAILVEKPHFSALHELQCGGNAFSLDSRKNLQGRFGSRLTFEYKREADHVYLFQARGRNHWYAGLGKDLTQVLILAGPAPAHGDVETLYFDHEGNRIDPAAEMPRYNWIETFGSWEPKIGLEWTTIHVKRFTTPEGHLRDCETWWLDEFDNPGHVTDHGQEDRTHFLRDDWLPNGRFTYTGGKRPWIDRTGKLIGI